MDPAESDPVRAALCAQGKRLNEQEDQLRAISQELTNASQREESVNATLSANLNVGIDHPQRLEQMIATPPPAPLSVPVEAPRMRLSSPEQFSGESGDCHPFLSQCELQFEFQPPPSPQTGLKWLTSSPF